MGKKGEVIVRVPRGRFWICLLLTLFGFGFAHVEARLGESPFRCEKLYGTPTGTTHVPGWIPNGIEYHRGEYSIICGFENNMCIAMLVMRISPANAILEAIPRDDVSMFMEDNFGHTSWAYTRFDDAGKFWRTHDLNRRRTYVASYVPRLKMLMLKIEES